MPLHESRVNYRNLIRDLAEMYAMDVAEVVVVELVANSLDAGAKQISIDYTAETRTLTIADDGAGMSSSQFEQYHDFAARLKARGSGIGFAGLGAKISFNIADQVITETRGTSFCGGSRWYIEAAGRLIWEDLRLESALPTGTRVEVRFTPDARIPYSTKPDMLALIRRHYLPLFDLRFLELYERLRFYSPALRFLINGTPAQPQHLPGELGLDRVREFFPAKRGKRFGYGFFGLGRADYPLTPGCCGVLVCTRGKVVKAELFDQFPGTVGPRILGVVEVPDLAEFLTTTKTDFLFRGKRRQFEALYGPIRDEFKAWLKEIGAESVEIVDADEAHKLERELQKLVDELPELMELASLPRRTEVLCPAEDGPIAARAHEGVAPTFPVGGESAGQGPGPVDIGEEPGSSFPPDVEGPVRAKPIGRVSRRGPRIALVMAPERIELAWIEGNSILINRGHPSFKKARANSAAQRLHSLFAIGNAVQKHLALVSNSHDFGFVDRMMAIWGRT